MLKTSACFMRQNRLHGKPFPICPVRSMIDPRIAGKTISQYFPINTAQALSLNVILRLYETMLKRIRQIGTDPSKFYPLNFFERVMKAKIEYHYS